jgi:inner membrane protein
MEPVTHMLTGACLSRAGLNRTTGLATLTLVLAAEAPDADVVAYFWGPIAGLQHHRGITHSLLGAPLIAGLIVGFVYGLYRAWPWLRRRVKTPVKWRLLFVYACIGGWLHLFQDFTNNYGVRPFAPFSERWISWDIVFIIDPVMLIALFVGLVVPGLLGLISDEVGAAKAKFRGRGGAIFALSVLLVLILVRDFEHRRAVTALKSLTYNGEEPLRISAFPKEIDFFAWNGVIETRDFLELSPVDANAGEVDPHNLAVVRYKPEETSVTLAAKQSRLGRVYLDWAQYPFLETEKLEGNRYKVSFRDFRFTSAEALRLRREGPLTGYVILDPQLRVVAQGTGLPPQLKPSP